MSISRILSSALVGTLLFALLFVVSVRSACEATPDPLSVTDLPFIVAADSGFKSADTLTIVVKSKKLVGRTDATITLETGTDACNYPATGSEWTKTEDTNNCFDIWTFDAAWSVASGCGLIRNDLAGRLVLQVKIKVEQTEDIADISSRGSGNLQRPVTNELIYELIFPETIEMVASPLTIYAPVLVQAAVTEKTYSVSNNQGTVKLFVSLQWPFQLATPSIATTAANVGTVTIGTSSSPCSATVDAACNRVYDITIPRGTACNLNGRYTITANVECISGITESGFECPVQATDAAASFFFDLTSEELCAHPADNVDLSGSLKSYSSLAFDIERNHFIQGQNAFFEVALLSNDVTIQAVTIEAVTSNWKSGSNTTVTFNTIAETPEVAAKARFSFAVTNSLFSLAADEEDTEALIYVRAGVTFVYTGVNGAKRTILMDIPMNKRQVYTKDVELAAAIELDVDEISAATTVVATFFGVLLAFAFVVIA